MKIAKVIRLKPNGGIRENYLFAVQVFNKFFVGIQGFDYPYDYREYLTELEAEGLAAKWNRAAELASRSKSSPAGDESNDE
jgi:hypothetical protein